MLFWGLESFRNDSKGTFTIYEKRTIWVTLYRFLVARWLLDTAAKWTEGHKITSFLSIL